MSKKKEEYTKLTKYFLASLAIPDDDQWVNLSPYEKDRIIKDDFGKTEMGRDLLAQDYMLKQITASLIYPEDNLGKKFWDKVYTQAQEQYGTTNIPVNTFNKVWILPDSALIYEKGNTAYVLKNHLRVMLEEDYLSLEKHSGITSIPTPTKNNINALGSKIVREIVLPELQREVNEDKNFAPLRQVYSGMLLATWYKHALKESLLSKIYANKSKVKGVDQDPKNNEEIYQQYLKAYKKGVFNFIKEDVDKYTNETIPRKYFSGGTKGYPADAAQFAKVVKTTSDSAQLGKQDSSTVDLAIVATDESVAVANAARKAQEAVPTASQATITPTADTAMMGGSEHLGSSNPAIRIDYSNRPIVLRFKNSRTLKIMKVFQMSSNDENFGGINPSVGYIITSGKKGEFKALRNGEEVKLGSFEDKTNPENRFPYNKNRFSWLDSNDGISRGHITISREGDRITLTDGIVWPDGTYKHSSYGTDVELQFEIGNEFGEHGNKIEGGVSNGREGNREIISVNFKEDINLSKMFNRIRESIQSMYPQYDLTRLPGEIRGQLLKLIFDEISDKVKYKDMLPQHEAGNLILVGDTIETGGVCRHMGILAAAIIERFINEGVLGGRIYYVRGHGHGWAVYETSDGAYSYVLDVAQDVLKDLNGKTYFGGDGLYLYSEDYQRVKLLEREQAVAPDAAMMTQKNLPAHRTSVVVNFDKDTKAIIINDEKTEKKLSITLYRSKDGTYSVSYGYEGGERLFEVVPFDMFKTNDMSKMGVTILRRRDQFTIVNNRRRNLVITTDNAMRTPLVVRLADEAALANPLNPLGGIDFNSANLNLQIKRDGKGVPLPISQQDLEHINIDGLIPIIIDIRPATSLPIFSELQTTSSSVT